jgi:hypothetical protein
MTGWRAAARQPVIFLSFASITTLTKIKVAAGIKALYNQNQTTMRSISQTFNRV